MKKRTNYTYDKAGNKTAIINAKGQQTTYHYDALHRLIEEINPMGHNVQYEYDADGNLAKRIDSLGRATVYEYDSLNRLTDIVYPQSSVTYTYNAVGSRTSMIDSTGITQYEYDDLDRLTKLITPDLQQLLYAYDQTGNKQTLTYPDNSVVTYDYDAANRLTTTTDGLNQIFETNYDKSNRRLSDLMPNGVATHYSYNPIGQLLSITNQRSSGALTEVFGQRIYTYDMYGNRSSLTDEEDQEISYQYDELQQLIGVLNPDESTVEYTYDAVGNRQTLNNGLQLDNYEYDIADRLLTVTSSVYGTQSNLSFQYDLNGNMTQKGDVFYEYDIENRLTQVTSLNGAVQFATMETEIGLVRPSMESQHPIFMILLKDYRFYLQK